MFQHARKSAAHRPLAARNGTTERLEEARYRNQDVSGDGKVLISDELSENI
jgi:hypothetical protein